MPLKGNRCVICMRWPYVLPQYCLGLLHVRVRRRGSHERLLRGFHGRALASRGVTEVIGGTLLVPLAPIDASPLVDILRMRSDSGGGDVRWVGVGGGRRVARCHGCAGRLPKGCGDLGQVWECVAAGAMTHQLGHQGLGAGDAGGIRYRMGRRGPVPLWPAEGMSHQAVVLWVVRRSSWACGFLRIL